mgnify:CR=1 FL=1
MRDLRAALRISQSLASGAEEQSAAAEEVARGRERLRGDLVFTWTADEERGGRYGARHIVENHPELLDAPEQRRIYAALTTAARTGVEP